MAVCSARACSWRSANRARMEKAGKEKSVWSSGSSPTADCAATACVRRGMEGKKAKAQFFTRHHRMEAMHSPL